MKQKRSFCSFLVFVTIVGLAGAGVAQDYRARVQGIVTDTSQAVVPGATVTLRNENTSVEIARESSESGHFLFDFVEPGRYTLSAELVGFSKFVQQNIQVQVRGDVTVNPVLNVGTVSETVTVSGETVAVQFNTTTMELTVDRKMLAELPILARNPFTLALLDPAVVNRYATLATRNPFFMWSSSQMDVGGSTSQRNDLQLDGAPLQLGWKGSYAPPMDAVQEFTVQQNSVDAEFGHSAGGVLSLSMKSGTNDYHGTAYYFGRNPALNAVSNRVVRAPNAVRNHIWGGTLGNPIVKNKLFTFNTYEAWRQQDPRNQILTLPTERERNGDFSQSFNQNGGLRTIYDPWTSVFATASRTPFPGNIIPQSRMDPTSLKFLQDIWLPNGPGDGITGVNNYKVAYHWLLKYWNFSNRTDWVPNDNWKIFGRYSRFRTDIDQNNYTPNNSPAMPNDNGGVMNSRNIAGDAVWTVNKSTVVNFRFSYATLNDDYDAPSAKVGEAGLQKFWSNGWYKPYLASDIPDIYYPNLIVNGVGSATFGKGGWWYQHPQSYNWSGRVSRNIGRHYLKAGGEERLLRGSSVRPNLMGFRFGSAMTANTFPSPDTRFSGDAWATFLLGAISGNTIGTDSLAQFIPLQRARTDFYGLYLHDDWKLTRRLTLNVGLRWEYETGLYDAEDRLSRALDLSSPIPEMQANPPSIPADIAAMRGKPYAFNGAWVFTDGDQRSSWDSPKNSFMPRFGVAYRVDDRTALRIGYARYITPPLVTTDTLGSARYPGFSALTNVAPVLQGIPGARLSDPFPASTNPLILPIGKARGRYTNLGNSPIMWDKQEFRTGVNDRFNLSVQRQLPAQLHLDVTYFVNLGHDLPYDKEFNLVDPNLIYTHKQFVDQNVANPFFNYLTPETFPGQLRNQSTVTRRSLLSTYPQYGRLIQVNTDGFLNRYHALQVRLQRQFSRSYSFLVAYNYNREKSSDFFNDIAQFNEEFTFLPSNNPRHRLAVAGTWELPLGRGRTLLSGAHPVVNGILGGWSTSWLFFANSGGFLRFNNAFLVTGDPRIENQTRDRWFDTSMFASQPAYTPRTNPKQYDGLTGPKFWNLDFTLAKVFPIVERYNLEVRMEAFNLTNSFIPTDPVINALGPNFGKSINQLNRGRELQYTVRLQF